MDNNERLEVAKKIARLLAESKANFYDLPDIDHLVRRHLYLSVLDKDGSSELEMTSK